MQKYRYLPLGDSYTICEGAPAEKAWPKILTKNINKEGIDIELLGNPAVTGYTTQNLIDKELPLFDELKPNFTTILIGVNDWVQEVSDRVFEERLIYILSHVQSRMPDPSKVILITIPDFGVTPEGGKYGKGRNISDGLTHFNNIIKNHAKQRDLPCVDIFPISKRMANEPDLVTDDHLHGSAKMYALWEELIRPVALNVLK